MDSISFLQMQTSLQWTLHSSCSFWEHENVKTQARTESIHFAICLVTCLLELCCAQGQKVPSVWNPVYFHNDFPFLPWCLTDVRAQTGWYHCFFGREGRFLSQCSWLSLSVWKVTFGCLGICWLTAVCSPTVLEAIISACFYIIIYLWSHRVPCLKGSYDLKHF